MRRLALLVGVLALIAPTAAIGRAPARVWIADRSPLVVRGSGFKAHERVTLTVQVTKPLIVKRVASTTGTFVVRLSSDTVKLGCNTLSVRAVGNRGTIAVAKVPGMECPPPPVDPTA